ncbi:MAG: hypothetical protein HYW96_00935 [Candidatus Wildermuthbacteria bacterium]|nr:hypothetical protein [Candidatus Wildermuthbacteria bacterium]
MLAPLGVNLPPGQRGQVDWMRWIDGYPILVAQYVGSRLPEGATTLPTGARIIWFLVDARSGSYHCTTCQDYTGRDDYASLLAREEVQLFAP